MNKIKSNILVTNVIRKPLGRRYPCDLFNPQASEAGSLKKHIQSVHEKIKYPCDLCDHKATPAENLKRHIQSVHEK